MPFALTDVTFSYDQKHAVDGISLDLAPGRFYGIIGPNGSGKTTLVDLLTGLRRPSSGSLAYQGKDLATLSKTALAREIALVPQNFYINFPFTAEEIVMMGRYPHMPRFSRPSAVDRRQVGSVMAATGTDEFRGRFITQLSGGERQRVVFARALVQDTPVLILDEGTSNLDVRHAIDLLNLAAAGVREQGRTVIAVLQDINLAAAYCDVLLFLKHGRIAAFGDAETVLTAETIRSVFEVDAKIYFDPFAGSNRVVFRSGRAGMP
jgi:cobalamin transport system ATP-binding protein